MGLAIETVQGWLKNNAHFHGVSVLKVAEIDLERGSLSASYMLDQVLIDVVVWEHRMSLDVLLIDAEDGSVKEALVGECKDEGALTQRLERGFRRASLRVQASAESRT
jgi:hypothetical protein